jgi:hypothetical protein
MRYDLDLTKPHFEKKRGDLMLYGAWHGQRLRPCLVVLPAYRMGKTVPLVVEVDDAWQWQPDDIDADPRRSAQLIGLFLLQNGMDASNAFTSMKVASLIHDHLGDLLRIPPKQTEDVVVADAFQTDHDTGKVTHKEVIERV